MDTGNNDHQNFALKIIAWFIIRGKHHQEERNFKFPLSTLKKKEGFSLFEAVSADGLNGHSLMSGRHY